MLIPFRLDCIAETSLPNQTNTGIFSTPLHFYTEAIKMNLDMAFWNSSYLHEIPWSILFAS
jgi:hypothetical protein